MDSVPASPSPDKCFPNHVQFQGTWRPYQARILDRLTEFIGDRRLHFIAAPGSGKTILGLEIIRLEEDKDLEHSSADEDENGNARRHFPDFLKLAAFRTLVVDEAHHLRSQWWKILTFVADGIDHSVRPSNLPPRFDCRSRHGI
jgi:superfamily II DNA or RNA helicase